MIKRSIIIGAIAFAMATPAFAVVSPFGGTSIGTDPLGDVYSASGTHWGSPGYGSGTIAFNPLNVSNDNGDYATSFSFTFLKGVAGTIDQTPSPSPFGLLPETRFTNLTDGVAWLVSFNGKEVTFTAPDIAARLDPGDIFFVNVAFTGHLNMTRFSFAGLWDDQPVPITFVPTPMPEPASWAMMLLGFGAVGAVVRRRRVAVTFA